MSKCIKISLQPEAIVAEFTLGGKLTFASWHAVVKAGFPAKNQHQ
jgi:hypothetical protein